MISVFRRGLFWRIYLTVLASLFASAVLTAFAFHVILAQVHPPRMGEHMIALVTSVALGIGVAAYPIVSRLTLRLEQLRASVEAWGEGRLDSRAPAEGGDEVAAVAESFNAAADHVERLLDAHRTLLAHASHELRSPLTRLRVAVEMLPAGDDPELRPGIERDIAELDALVEEILLASRLDQSSAAPPAEPVDLLALAAEEAARGGAILKAEDLSAHAFEVMGAPRLLRRLVRNLIDNANRHGAPPVEVELARDGETVTLRVRDHGSGIPEAERARVFEPFYRPSGWSEAAGGWGLGLSIVRQIVERSGGSIACEAADDGGAAFLVRLPAAR